MRRVRIRDPYTAAVIRGNAAQRRQEKVSLDLSAVGAVGVMAYFVIAGDLAWRDPHGGVRIVSGLLAAGIILLYIARAPGRADRFDRRLLFALLVFAVACVFSQFRRQSFDSVLACLLYVSALFVARGILARESARRLFIAGLMTLSALFTVATASQVIPPFVEWWALTDWTVFPPLDLKVIPEPWIFRYEITILLVLLYPSWWIGRITTLRAVTAVVVGALIIAVCLVVGSRTVWLATCVAATAIVLPLVRRRFRWDVRRVAAILAVIGVVLVTLIVSGLDASLGERVARSAPLAERGSLWQPLLGAWLDRPLVGYGPGSFPWVLQLTDYFDTHSFSPRHADSAIVQLVVEGGIFGIVASLIVFATVMPAVIRGQSSAATFAVAVFVLAQVGLNPAEFAFVTAIVIAWIAFGVPRERPTESATPTRTRVTRVRPVLLGAVSILGLAYGATIAAAVAYSSAREAIGRGDLANAESSLTLSTLLDPGLAIYPRQLGTVRLISGNTEGAIEELERATTTNPSDDLAWRVLGIAQMEAGDEAASLMTLRQATGVQRSDATNLLLMAQALRSAGDNDGAAAVLAEIVQAWPTIVAAPGWANLIAPLSTTELTVMARDRWVEGLPSPEQLDAQRLLLGVMTGLPDAALDEEPARMSDELKAAYVSVMRCDPRAGTALTRATDADRRQPTYWALATRLAKLEGKGPSDYQRIFRIMTGDSVLSDDIVTALNPLRENGVRQSSADTWGYRRPPIDWPATQWDLPSPRSGIARWHIEPTEAVAEAGIQGVLHKCQ